MKNKFIALTILVISSCVFTEANAKTAAIVNNQKITTEEIDFLSQTLPVDIKKDAVKLNSIKSKILNQLIESAVLSQKAISKGYANNPNVLISNQLAKQDILVRFYIDNYIKNHRVTERQLEAAYRMTKENLGSSELHLKHILVSTNKEALDILDKLKNGASFEEMAKKYSIDTGSKVNGGDLGWNSPTVYVKEFAEAAKKLQEKHYTTNPVKTQFGWHIIYLDGTRSLKAPEFKDIKPQLEQFAKQEDIKLHIEQLKADANIKILYKY